MSNVDTRARGAEVEAAALAYLKREGLREVAANANYRGGELDLVMFDDGRFDDGRFDDGRFDVARLNSGRPGGHARTGSTLVFVEVRYRRHAGFGGGAASITAGKRRKLVHAAQQFLVLHREFANTACRFDVIEADGDPQAPRLHWLRDAFRADDG
ncbi:MAG: YraN family protein [Luteimonas sp.]